MNATTGTRVLCVTAEELELLRAGTELQLNAALMRLRNNSLMLRHTGISAADRAQYRQLRIANAARVDELTTLLNRIENL